MPIKETKQIVNPTGDTDKVERKQSAPEPGEVTVNEPVPPAEPKRTKD